MLKSLLHYVDIYGRVIAVRLIRETFFRMESDMRLLVLLVVVTLAGCHAVDKVALKATPKYDGKYEFALEFTPKR